MSLQPSRYRPALSPEATLVSRGPITERRRLAHMRRRSVLQMNPIWYPLAFFQIYLLCSVLAYAFGPVENFTPQPFYLFGYLLAGQVAIFVGYQFGIAARPTTYVWSTSPQLLIRAALLAMLTILPLTLIWRGHGDLSILESLQDPGAAYSSRLKSIADGEVSSQFSLLRGAMAPLLQLFLPLGIVYWKMLSRSVKTLWLVGVFGMVIQAATTGAATGIFDLVLALPWLFWLAIKAFPKQSKVTLKPRHNARLRRPSSMKRWALIGLAGAALMAGIHYFNYTRQARYGLESNEYLSWTVNWSQEKYGVQLPNSVEYPIYMLTAYWTNGYEGLSQCLELPFEWCFGTGHSAVLMRYGGLLTTDPNFFWDRCYPARLEEINGYSANGRWHTIYAWLASDLTFPGALVAVGILAALMAQSWRDSIGGRNPFAIAFFVQTLMVFYYVPANNGRLSFSEEMIAFWVLLILWKLSRKRIQPKRILRKSLV